MASHRTARPEHPPAQGKGFAPGSSAVVVRSNPPIALKRNRDGSVDVLHFERGETLHASGQLAAELREIISGAKASKTLKALAKLQPLLAEVIEPDTFAPPSPTAVLRAGHFDTLFIELTDRCNESCVHCYADATPRRTTFLPTALALAAIRDAAALGFRRVQLTGGDPLLASNLPLLIQAILDHGLLPEIYTNGLALTDTLLDSLQATPTALAFSFYSHRPEIHDAITQTPGSQRRTLAAIKRALARGLAVRVAIIVLEKNCYDIPATTRFLRRRGVHQVASAPARGVGRGQTFAASASTLASHRPLGDTQAGSGTLCILPTGEVTPCIFNRQRVLGSLASASLQAIVARPATSRIPMAFDWQACRDRLQCAGCQAVEFAFCSAAFA